VTGKRGGPAEEPDEGHRCPTEAMSTADFQLLERTTAIPAPSGARARELCGDPDAGLVARWQDGDAGAFEELVRRHQGRVYRLVLRMLGNAQEAEDVAQEAFLSLHRHGHRFRREARFSTFMYRVATNAALNRRRRLSRIRAREEEFALRQAAGDDLPATPRDPEGAAVGAEVQVRVQQALLSLPPDLRAAIILYDIEGQSYRDIAAILGVPEGTVKSRIHRARGSLRDRLESAGPGSGSSKP
jgi:RNA polymerase sigma-70 factor (ECF subfamily)